MIDRRGFLAGLSAAACTPAFADTGADASAAVVLRWHRLVLQLVRHTATYSPPVAARAFAYLGVGLWETLAAARGYASLAGQVNGVLAPPAPPGRVDLPSALNGALAAGTAAFFGNTGPSGQQAMRVTEARIRDSLPAHDPASAAFGAAVMASVVAWSRDDGGAVVKNLGFGEAAPPPRSPQDWVPTSAIRLQQAPLLPAWGDNRPIVLHDADAFMPAPPLPFSTEPGSPFFAEAQEVYDVSLTLTAEQELIARFWSDDPMLSPTPPGHWISILVDVAERDAMPVESLCNALAQVGIAQNDAFIVCWRAKFRYNLLRPVTYIRANISPDWQPLLITPPFPEYTSGHSSQSAAAAEVLSGLCGEDFAFDDATHVREDLPVRSFPSFRAAAAEAAMSRLYGGIHFRRGNEQGAAQGVAVGQAVLSLRTL